MKPTDAELLRRYAEDGSESAFAELVKRHVDLVYGAAIRQAWGDVTLAEDLTQAVFTAMACQAGTLTQHPVLSGWLYNYVRHLAANQHRADQRRQRREQASIKMNTPNDEAEADALWEDVKPVLDDAMEGLEDKDRNAVVLRFYQERSLREVGTALGLSENAARMRVARALTKLRDLLTQRGVSSSTAGLATALVVGATLSAPSGMAATVATNALAATACAATSTTTTTLTTIMSMTKVQIGMAAVVVTAGLGVTALQESRVRKLSHENTELQTQVTALSPLRAELAQLKSEVAKADPDVNQRKSELEIAGLRGRLTMAKIRELESPPADTTQSKTKQSAESEPAPEVVAPKMNAIMRASMRMAMESQTLAKLPQLKKRLALSPAQEEAVRAILQRQYDEGLEMATNMLAGNLSMDDIKARAEAKAKAKQGAIVDPKSEIQALLSPEQKAAYEEHQQEERVSMARLAANGELLQMQNPLGLTQDQQDQAFEALYHQSMGQKTNPPPSSGSPDSTMQWMVDQKVRALEPVLTPEQLEKYRKMQEQRMKMASSLMPAQVK
ncbi:MAG: RNA polymerase sigma factor [Limisphaerales bacterium]